jgi:hypothetical protein
VLARIPKRATTILTNSYKPPWMRNGFGTAFNRQRRMPAYPTLICTSRRATPSFRRLTEVEAEALVGGELLAALGAGAGV